mmetsp:Transcript_40980/g.46564  ORF Transcript_40980/g.46564 Transcript_40980/m.46564 type:complete len:260 (+) Transcript_40980:60-839(+)
MNTRTIYFLTSLIPFIEGWALVSELPHRSNKHGTELSASRRNFLEESVGLVTAAGSVLIVASSDPVNAFENRVPSKYDDRPRQRGSKASDLGVIERKSDTELEDDYIGFKKCAMKPNCFCSTDSMEFDPEHAIPSWKWPSNMKRDEAFQQLEKTIKDYQPGQNNIDGGGFKIITSQPPKYLYVQFESLKNGFVDDVEFASLSDNKNEIQVRSSSRLGFLDFGVNAKRLNYISAALRKQGWDAIGVDYKTHPEYAGQNQL